MQQEVKENILQVLRNLMNPPLTELSEDNYDIAYVVLFELSVNLLKKKLDSMDYVQLAYIHYFLAELSKELCTGREDTYYEEACEFMYKGGIDLPRDERLEMLKYYTHKR